MTRKRKNSEKRIFSFLICEAVGILFLFFLLPYYAGPVAYDEETIFELLIVLPSLPALKISELIIHFIPIDFLSDFTVFVLVFIFQMIVYAIISWIINMFFFRDKKTEESYNRQSVGD